MMERTRLAEILAGFQRTRVLVVGDYFLDKYLDIDRSLAEISLETGLEAHQVVRVRCSPGAAGTVVSNLRALEVQVSALGAIGDDGEGYELLRGLDRQGVDTDALLRLSDRYTPTYTKPMMHEADGRVHELSRLDIKNRAPLPASLEDALIERINDLAPVAQGVIIADQAPERNCGVLTDRVREALIDVAERHRGVVMAVDSRMRIGEYREMALKPNEREAVRAIDPQYEGEISLAAAEGAGRELAKRAGQPVYVTVGDKGILFCSHEGCQRIPAVKVTGPIDIVGAGDSTMAGIVSGLCCGATPAEAALLGNLVASVTIRCLGTTGVASQKQVLQALEEWHRGREQP